MPCVAHKHPPCWPQITLQLDWLPERFQLPAELSKALNLQYGYRNQIMGKFWDYVRVKGLQNRQDTKLLELDGTMEKVGGAAATPAAATCHGMLPNAAECC